MFDKNTNENNLRLLIKNKWEHFEMFNKNTNENALRCLIKIQMRTLLNV